MQTTAVALDTPVWRGILGSRLFRFACVSGFNVILGQTLLYVFFYVVGLAALVANISAVVLSMIPGYLLSRFWVWDNDSGQLFSADAVPFFALNALGLALSSAAVVIATSNSTVPFVANAASIFAYGLVWVLKFIVLDRFVWPDRTQEVL